MKPNRAAGAWDQFSVHDSCPPVYRGRIHCYHKADRNGAPAKVPVQGLATADRPFGPFTKRPLHPLPDSGPETTRLPFRDGIAALVIRHGRENDAVQYAPEGLNFDVAANPSLMPVATGPYVPDAFTDAGAGRGITGGLSHFTDAGMRETRRRRLDCDPSRDLHGEGMKRTEVLRDAERFFAQGAGRSRRMHRRAPPDHCIFTPQ
ncbi:MAG: hypothetical protein ACO3JJ_07540 [Opitutaceae bacterium]